MDHEEGCHRPNLGDDARSEQAPLLATRSKDMAGKLEDDPVAWPMRNRPNNMKRILGLLGLVLVLVVAASLVSRRTGDAVAASSSSSSSASSSSSSGATWTVPSTPPHIVVLLADDQGSNDIGYQSTDLSAMTPHIDALAAAGVKLTNYYGAHVCTPARATMLTGMLPVHLGMGHHIVTGSHPYAMPLDVATLPQFLQAEGLDYATVSLGKWHLGHFKHAHLPMQRGFDTHDGFYSGFQDYYTHVGESSICALVDHGQCFVDMRSGAEALDTSAYESREDAYSPAIWKGNFDAAVESAAASGDPLFVYYAEALVHEPLEAPLAIWQEYGDLLDEIPNHDRRTFAAMTIYLDLVVEGMTASLQERGLWDTTVFIYASDNGGDPPAIGSGSNWPLRGRKSNLFEGGVRVPAFVYSPLLPSASRGTDYGWLMHASDWLPTIVSGILGRPDLLLASGGVAAAVQSSGLDGVDQWASIVAGSTMHGEDDDGGDKDAYPSAAPRGELLLGIDYLDKNHSWTGYDTAGVVAGRWKLVTGEVNETWWPVPPTSANVTRKPLEADGSGDDVFTFLFDLWEDPYERVNLVEERPEVAEALAAKLALYRATLVDALFCPTDDAAGEAYQSAAGGWVEPWVTGSAIASYTCPWRYTKDGVRQHDFNPSFLDGSSYEGLGGSDDFGDDD